MMNEKFLETKRLNISIPTLDSLDNWYKLRSNPEIMRFIGGGSVNDTKQVKLHLQKVINNYDLCKFTMFDIYEKSSGEFIGEAGLTHVAYDFNNPDIELGYKILPLYQGLGYATELAEFFIKWGFEKLNLDRIIACCDKNNIASSNVMKKCDMKYQGKYLYNGKNECDIYHINNIVIKTDNFYLRPFHEKDDFDLSYNLWNDEDVLKSMECQPCTKEDIKEKLARYKLWMDKFGFTNFAVFTKDSDDFVGSCGMSLFHDPDNDRNPLQVINSDKYLNRDVEIGYVLHKKYWGKGCATELAKACVNFVFSADCSIKRIVAVTVPSSMASQNVLSKIGFKFEKEVSSKEYGKENFYVVDRAKDAEVILSEYDSGWVQKLEEEKKFLLNIIGDYFCGSVEHVGSTSVSGLIAKPVIDIMFGVKSLPDSKQAIEVLTQNGYNYFPYKEDVMHWFCKPSPEMRTHHLHLVPFESDLWNERIRFRDILKKNTKIADEYVLLKKNLATKYKDNREAYTEGKSSFIKRILNKFN